MSDSVTLQPRGGEVVLVLARREIVRFLRQPARVAAAIGTPCLLWALIASGFAESLRPEALGSEVGYAAFLLPGMMTLVAVFASVFASISVIEDRQAGWLQAVLVAPVPRWSIALGRIVGGTLVAWAQAMVLLPAAYLLGLAPGPGAFAVAALAAAVTAVAMSSLGLALAWRSESTGSFHAVMNLLFMPMWLLSGAFFPMDGAAGWMRSLMLFNPLTWCTEAIRGPLLGQPWLLPLVGSFGFALVMVVLAGHVVGRRETGL